jgi:tetratricopeptide (TPR) repeat protein
MKNAIVTVGMLVFFGAALFGQTMHSYESSHYIVRSEVGGDHAKETAEMMEAYFDLFQSYMHFDAEELAAPLKIKVFERKADYDSYVESLIDETRDSFVFLHYENNPEKSELVAFSTDDEELFSKRIVHHGYIQYIKSFVDNPPLYLQKGFAVYFEKSSYNESKKSVSFRHNYGWVPYLRSRLSEKDEKLELIPLNTLLYIDEDMANRNLEAFYAQAWGMVEFMAHSDTKAYNRLLWDSISALSPSATARENERSIVRNAFEWVNRESLVSDFIRYVKNIKTFPDRIELGMEAYSMGSYDEAEKHFQAALELNEEHYVPHYYLGLIYYEKAEYSMAEYYYQTALKSGGNKALIHYALGVNAFADRRFEDARYYLGESKDADSTYAEKADTLIERIDDAERSGDGSSGSSGSTGSSGSSDGSGSSSGSSGDSGSSGGSPGSGSGSGGM